MEPQPILVITQLFRKIGSQNPIPANPREIVTKSQAKRDFIKTEVKNGDVTTKRANIRKEASITMEMGCFPILTIPRISAQTIHPEAPVAQNGKK